MTLTIPAGTLKEGDIIEINGKFKPNNYTVKIMEMEELKIETEQGATITCKAWDKDGDLTIIMDRFNTPQTWLTLDQTTQLRDWLTGMIDTRSL